MTVSKITSSFYSGFATAHIVDMQSPQLLEDVSKLMLITTY